MTGKQNISSYNKELDYVLADLERIPAIPLYALRGAIQGGSTMTKQLTVFRWMKYMKKIRKQNDTANYCLTSTILNCIK